MAGELQALWLEEDAPENYLNRQNLNFVLPSFESVEKRFLTSPVNPEKGKQLVLARDVFIKSINNGMHRGFANKSELTFDVTGFLDEGATLEAGKDYYVYLVDNDISADLVVSMQSTYPRGATADTSRKIGGFHTLCANVGTIEEHKLTEYTAGSILPDTVWSLGHRPRTCGAEGMFYNNATDWWVCIYLQTGTGTGTASRFGGTTTRSRTYSNHLEDFLTVGQVPIPDYVFTAAAEGSNQKTVVKGAAASSVVTTGGHVNTAGRRMISHEGGEDMCGAVWQWCEGWSWGTASPTDGSGYVADSGGAKGSVHRVNALLAGGAWDSGAVCGSRARQAAYSRLYVYAGFGGRGAAPNV